MKTILRWCLLACLALAGHATAQTSNSEIQSGILALENTWLQSQKNNNPDLIAPALADNFVETLADGRVLDRSQALADAKATHYTFADYGKVVIVVYNGDTAIATSDFIGRGTDAKGKAFDAKQRFTDTWVKVAPGKWQCVASHSSTIAP